MPIKFSGQKLSLLVKPGHLDARLAFLDGEWKGRVWGTSQGNTYTVDTNGARLRKEDDTVAFNGSGYRFFFLMPFHLSEEELITHAGTQDLHGAPYDLVYATWGSWEPRRTVDQYLIWINLETAVVDFV